MRVGISGFVIGLRLGFDGVCIDLSFDPDIEPSYPIPTII